MGHSLSIQDTGVSVLLGTALLILWLMVAGCSVRDLSARAMLSLTGHLRTRPDPWLERTLRAAFAEFDRELALILQDRGPQRAAAPPPPRASHRFRDLPPR